MTTKVTGLPIGTVIAAGSIRRIRRRDDAVLAGPEVDEDNTSTQSIRRQRLGVQPASRAIERGEATLDRLFYPGLALFVLGLALTVWAYHTLGRFFSLEVQIQNEHNIVDSGPYRVLRHPGYAGVAVGFLGLE